MISPHFICALLVCFFKLLPILPTTNPANGSNTKTNKVSLTLIANKTTMIPMIFNGSLIIPSNAPIMEFSNSAISFEDLLNISPFLCSVKYPIGNCKILSYNNLEYFLVTAFLMGAKKYQDKYRNKFFNKTAVIIPKQIQPNACTFPNCAIVVCRK